MRVCLHEFVVDCPRRSEEIPPTADGVVTGLQSEDVAECVGVECLEKESTTRPTARVEDGLPTPGTSISSAGLVAVSWRALRRGCALEISQMVVCHIRVRNIGLLNILPSSSCLPRVAPM